VRKAGIGLLVVLSSAISSLAYSAELPDVEYRATVLVCDFQTPDLPAEKGLLAAETVAAAVEAAGLAHAVRPSHAVTQDWGYAFDVTGSRNPQKDAAGHWSAGSVNPYGSPVSSPRLEEGAAEPAEFRVEGVVSLMGRTWWVKASLSDAATAERLLSSSASAEGDTGLLEASKAVAAQLEAVYGSQVLEQRSEAVRRSVAIGDLSRATALKRLEEMHQRWPDALPPAAMGLLLASSAERADPQAVIPWGVRTVERLPAAGLAGKRFLLRLGITNPYELLASAYQSAGKPEEAATVRRKAEEEGYSRPTPAPVPGAAQPSGAKPAPDSSETPAGPVSLPGK